jgi:hypothetical protein
VRYRGVLIRVKRLVPSHSGLTTSSHSGHSAKTPTLPSSCSHSISFHASEIDRLHSGHRPSDEESEFMGNGGESCDNIPPNSTTGFWGIIVLLSCVRGSNVNCAGLSLAAGSVYTANKEYSIAVGHRYTVLVYCSTESHLPRLDRFRLKLARSNAEGETSPPRRFRVKPIPSYSAVSDENDADHCAVPS